jgi:serine/threonine protein kinase
VHRDVSPGNVMLTDTGEVKVLDFGIAQVDLGSTGPASARGTVAYLAPEVERGGGAGPRSDVYALGAVLVELLTGAPPDRGEVMGVPAVLDEVVRRCLAADPPTASRAPAIWPRPSRMRSARPHRPARCRRWPHGPSEDRRRRCWRRRRRSRCRPPHGAARAGGPWRSRR